MDKILSESKNDDIWKLVRFEVQEYLSRRKLARFQNVRDMVIFELEEYLLHNAHDLEELNLSTQQHLLNYALERISDWYVLEREILESYLEQKNLQNWSLSCKQRQKLQRIFKQGLESCL